MTVTRLLLVEDNPADAMIIAEALESLPPRWGTYSLEVCEDLRSAVAALQSDREHDCALVDLSLPDARGSQSIDRMIRSHPELPIVVFSGSDENSSAREALRRGAQDFLAKQADIDPEVIARTIANAIDRSHAARSLVEANRHLAAFAGRLAHDLRSPLAVATGMLQLIDRKAGDKLDEETTFLLGRAVNGVARASDMVTALLHYVQATYPDTATEVMDLSEVVDWAVETVALSYPDLSVEQVGDLPDVEANSGALRQAFVNLLSNAAKYADLSRPVRVLVRATAENDVWHIEVVDNGVGIAAEHRDAVFGEGHQIERAAEGFGLGLAAVRAVVERYGGEVWIGEGDGGVGTCVHLRLPRP